jgi:hypothetical protein
VFLAGEWPYVIVGVSQGGVRGGGGHLPGREEETSGTTATFEHTVPRRRDAGHCALRGISVVGAGASEIQHCA